MFVHTEAAAIKRQLTPVHRVLWGFQCVAIDEGCLNMIYGHVSVKWFPAGCRVNWRGGVSAVTAWPTLCLSVRLNLYGCSAFPLHLTCSCEQKEQVWRNRDAHLNERRGVEELECGGGAHSGRGRDVVSRSVHRNLEGLRREIKRGRMGRRERRV